MHILNWKLGLARYNQVKHLKLRWPWIMSVDPTPNDKGAYLRHTEAGHATRGTDWSDVAASQGCLEPPRSCKRQERPSPPASGAGIKALSTP